MSDETKPQTNADKIRSLEDDSVDVAREQLAAAEQLAEEQAAICARRRAAAKLWLKAVNVDPKDTPDEVLDLFGFQLEQAPPEGEEPKLPVLNYDEELGIIHTEDDEFVAFLTPIEGGDDRVVFLKNLGERFVELEAKKAGQEAERDVWLAKVAKQYAPKINRTDRFIKRLEYLYTPMAKAYLDDVRAAADKKPPLSAKVGLLHIGYTTQREKCEVPDERKAVEWIEGLIEGQDELPADAVKIPGEAIKVVKSLLVSVIPREIKEAAPPESGIEYRPAGDLKFGFK